MTEIIVTFAVEGFHCWPDAPKVEPRAFYLCALHRHLFHFTCWKKVEHNNRDIEFQVFRRDIMKWLAQEYRDRKNLDGALGFQQMSCEEIATVTLNQFGLTRCRVMEDNENGAQVTAIQRSS